MKEVLLIMILLINNYFVEQFYYRALRVGWTQ